MSFLKMTIDPSEDVKTWRLDNLWDDKWRGELRFDGEDIPRRGRIQESLGPMIYEWKRADSD